jgi:glycosyltransferase involved in cell wall biosynthesis
VAASYCILSTYTPTQCGLATFTAALRDAMAATGDEPACVVQVSDAPVFKSRPEVVAHLRNGRPESAAAAAFALNQHDIAIVQHDYDAYGGPDGCELINVLARVTVPVVVVLHTVLAYPTPHQRTVLERVVAAADSVVTMTETARQRLVLGYRIDVRKIVVIPHGAVRRTPEQVFDRLDDRPTILTWGLLGPGKGIEWALAGLRDLRQLDPLPRYVIAGQTHPRVRQQQGEAYRLRLATRAKALGVAHLIRFERQYLDDVALRHMIDSADVVLLPYDSHEQVTSGVLIEAVAAHKPVVSTVFPHAVELLGSGAGLLVPHADGPAIGAALRKVLTDPLLAHRMSVESARVAPGLHWPVVAERYRSLFDGLLAARSVVTG